MNSEPAYSRWTHPLKRRSRRHRLDSTPPQGVLADWVLMALLGLPLLLALVFYGGVKNWIAAPLLAVQFTGLAIVFLRRARAPEAFSFLPASLFFGLFLVYAALRIPGAPSRYDAAMEVLSGLGALGACWGWAALAPRHKRWALLLALLVGAVSVLAWYAIVQTGRGSNGVLFMVRPEQYGLRASGTFICPNHFAHLLAMVWCLTLALACTGAASVSIRMISAYAFLLFVPALALTGSRSGWLGAAAGIWVTAVLMARRRNRAVFLAVLFGVPLLLGLAAAGGMLLYEPLRARVLEAVQLQGSADFRLKVWPDIVTLIRERPLLGWGPAALNWVYPRVNTLFFNRLTYAHNEYLNLLADYGLAGTLLLGLGWLGLLGWSLRQSWRARRMRDAFLLSGLAGALVATFVHAAFDFNLHIFASLQVLAMLVGVTTACARASDAEENVAPARAGPRWGLLALAVLFAACALRSAQVSAGEGLLLLGDGRARWFDYAGAERFYRLSQTVLPGNPEVWLRSGELAARRAFWSRDERVRRAGATAARQYFEQAARRNPLDMRAEYGLAQAWNLLGDSPRALEGLRRAAGYEKDSGEYLLALCQQLQDMQRPAEALSLLEAAAARGMHSARMDAVRDRLRAEAAATSP